MFQISGLLDVRKVIKDTTINYLQGWILGGQVAPDTLSGFRLCPGEVREDWFSWCVKKYLLICHSIFLHNTLTTTNFLKRGGAIFRQGVPLNGNQWTKWPEILHAGEFCGVLLSFGQVEVTHNNFWVMGQPLILGWKAKTCLWPPGSPLNTQEPKDAKDEVCRANNFWVMDQPSFDYF